ncbi:hypothetical protein ACTQ56_00725 [[Clostridium] aminophilum]|uniref:hypothetical protein n=1 Tax=[Clostridium] aminophilum TaxID=1526 RepID=UPI003F99EF9B
MAIMNRNVNLEEINTDALLGISFMIHQTVGQKILLFTGVITGIGFNLANSFWWNLNPLISLFLTLIPLLLGIAFGCNYNEDLTVIRYLILIVSRPVQVYTSAPAEDLEQIRNREEMLRREEEEYGKRNRQMSDEAQMKLLKRLVIGVVVYVAVLIVSVTAISSMKTETKHHDISIQTEAKS